MILTKEVVGLVELAMMEFPDIETKELTSFKPTPLANLLHW